MALAEVVFRKRLEPAIAENSRLGHFRPLLQTLDSVQKPTPHLHAYVRGYHPTAVFECLWPLDANQGTPKPSATFRALNFYVNLPSQWKNSSYDIKYFRCEAFDYDVWQKNSNLMKQAITFATTALGRPASECMFLSGLYGPPDPPMAQAYGLWLPLKLYSFCYWAFDQFCLNSRPVPLEIAGQMQVTGATYYKPLAARAIESVIAVPVVAVAGGALKSFRSEHRTGDITGTPE